MQAGPLFKNVLHTDCCPPPLRLYKLPPPLPLYKPKAPNPFCLARTHYAAWQPQPRLAQQLAAADLPSATHFLARLGDRPSGNANQRDVQSYGPSHVHRIR